MDHMPADANMIEVTVLRTDPSCTDTNTCHGITQVAGDDEFFYLVGDPVTDPALLAAHAHRIGEGEQLFRFRRRVIPEVAP
jgi:hypothetical protein